LEPLSVLGGRHHDGCVEGAEDVEGAEGAEGVEDAEGVKGVRVLRVVSLVWGALFKKLLNRGATRTQHTQQISHNIFIQVIFYFSEKIVIK